MSMPMRTIRRGFTLLEAMIVLAVLAIVVAVAYPSYTEYVMRANRTDAKNLLMLLAAEQEKFFTTFHRYSGSINGARTGVAATSGLNMRNTTQENPTDTAYYDVEVALNNANRGYVMRAIPRGSQQTQDRCGTFTLDHLGNRGAARDDCW